jgi:DNA-binding ferritin-like protein
MSDTPRTDVAKHNMGSIVEPHYVVDVEIAQGLERELAEAKEQLRLCNIDQFTTAAELSEAQEVLNDKRKFCYAVEQALDGMKGDYVEIIKELRKDAERYRWLRERHENTVMDIYNSISPAMKPELLDAVIDAAMKEGGK